MNTYPKDVNLRYVLVWTDMKLKRQQCINFNSDNCSQSIKNIKQLDQLNSCFIQTTLNQHLKVYGQNVKLQFFAIISSFKPLKIQVFNEALVKLYDGELFIDSQKITKAQLSMTEFFQILEERGYSKSQVNQIWSACCKRILKSILTFVSDIQLLSLNTFQVIQYTFNLSQDLKPYIYKVKIDHKFPKKGNYFDVYKKAMLKEILGNVKQQAIKQQIFNLIKASINTPKFLYLMKKMQNDSDFFQNQYNEEDSLDILLKEDYSKPQVTERTVNNISQDLFKKINKQQALISKEKTGKKPNYDEILETIKIEKTLIPIFYHYKRGKVAMMNTFLQKASMDQPTSQRLYQEYLEKWQNQQSIKNSNNINHNDQFMRENQNQIALDRVKIIKNHDKSAYLKIYQDENDPQKILIHCLNLDNVLDFLKYYPMLQKFSEQTLQQLLYEIYKDSRQNFETFTQSQKILQVLIDSNSDLKCQFKELIQMLQSQFENANRDTQNKNQLSNKPVKIFFKTLRKVLLLQESSQTQQCKTKLNCIQLRKSKSEHQLKQVNKQNIINNQSYQTLDQYLFGSIQNTPHTPRTNQIMKNYSQSLRKYQNYPGNYSQKISSSQQKQKDFSVSILQTQIIKDNFKTIIQRLGNEQCLIQASQSCRNKQSLLTPQSRNSFLFVKPSSENQFKTIEQTNDRTQLSSSRLSKRLSKVTPKTPREVKSNYLDEIRQQREHKQQKQKDSQEQMQNKDPQQQQLMQGFFSQRRHQRFEEEQKQIQLIKERVAFGIQTKMKIEAKQQEVEKDIINNGDQQTNLLQSLDNDSDCEYDYEQIKQESLLIHSIRLREKYIQSVVQIHKKYKQQNIQLIKIFPFNKESDYISKEIQYKQVVIYNETENNDIDNAFVGRKKPIFVQEIENKEQISKLLLELVAHKFEDFVFIRDKNIDILDSTIIQPK